MRRRLALLAFALGALGRRRARSLAVGAALALVTAAFASAVFMTDALREEGRREVAALPDLTVERLHAGRPATLAAGDAALVAAIPGVLDVRPRVWGYLYVAGLEANLVVVGVDAARDRGDLGTLLTGTLPAAGSRGWVALGAGAAHLLAVHPGDGIELGAPGVVPVPLRVTATFRSASALRTADAALTAPRDARALLGMADGEATDLAVTLASSDEASVVTRKVARALPGARVVDRRSLARAFDLTWSQRGGLVMLALLPSLLALLVMAWDRATGLGAGERREVGVLKCVGWSTGDVLAARLMESAVLAAGAAGVGVLGAYGYVFALGAPGLRAALLGWSVLHPRFDLAPAVTATEFVTLAALTVAPYLAAAVIPAWRAATLDPADAMRE